MMKQGLPDMELRWRAEDIRDGWERSTKVVLGDLYDHEGQLLDLDGRGA